jgi:hypothetical protein
MFATLLFPIKIAILLIGALYLFVAYKDAKRIYPFMLRIFGKKAASKLGSGMSRIVMYAVGGVISAIALVWLF